MATHLDENTGAAEAADVADEIAGGLEADDEATHLAAVWNGLVARGDELAVRVRAAERRTGRARSRLNVVDSRWDATDSAFSRRTLDEAHGDTNEAPYKTFYAKASASEINAFGVQREIDFGRKTVEVLAIDPSSPLTAEWSPRWVADTDALEAAAGARDAAVLAEAPIDAEQTLYISAINIELDRLEGDLKKLFPGQPKRVSAFLAATRTRKRRKAKVEDGGDGT